MLVAYIISDERQDATWPTIEYSWRFILEATIEGDVFYKA